MAGRRWSGPTRRRSGPSSRRRRSRNCRSTDATSPRSSTWRRGSRRGRRARTSRAPARSTRAARPTSTRSASQANTNAWLVDGIDNNEFTFNTVIVAPSVEQVREFKVLYGVFSAEFGRGAGVVSVSTKSGTNEFHGTVFDFIRNDAFDAHNYFVRKDPPPTALEVTEAAPPPAPVRRRHRRRRWSCRALRRAQPHVLLRRLLRPKGDARRSSFVNTVPTAAQRNGDFSDFRDPQRQPDPHLRPADDAAGPDARPGGIRSRSVPGQHHSTGPHPPGRANIASIYPLPNQPGNFDNYISTRRTARSPTTRSPGASITACRTTTRSSSASTTASSSSTPRRARRPAACRRPSEAAARFDLGPFVAGIQNTRLTTHGAGLQLHEGLSARPSSTSSASATPRTLPFTTQSDYGHEAATSLGIQGINVNEITTGLPNINITDFTGISGGPAFLPVNPKQFHYQFEDALVLVEGAPPAEVRLPVRRSACRRR